MYDNILTVIQFHDYNFTILHLTQPNSTIPITYNVCLINKQFILYIYELLIIMFTGDRMVAK